MPYPFSNDEKLLAVNKGNNFEKNLNIKTYNTQDLKIINETKINGEDNLVGDKYEPNNIYTFLNTNEPNSKQDNFCYLYKNGEQIFKTNEINKISNVFTTKNYIFLLGEKIINWDSIGVMIKINKATLKVETTQNFDSAYYNYIGTGVDNNAYLYLDDDVIDGIYKLSEDLKSFAKIPNSNFEMPTNVGVHNNHIYMFRNFDTFIEGGDSDEIYKIGEPNLIVYEHQN